MDLASAHSRAAPGTSRILAPALAARPAFLRQLRQRLPRVLVGRGPGLAYRHRAHRQRHGRGVGDRLVAHRQRRRCGWPRRLPRGLRDAHSRDHRGVAWQDQGAASLVRGRSAHRPRLHGRDAHLEDLGRRGGSRLLLRAREPRVRRSRGRTAPAHRQRARGTDRSSPPRPAGSVPVLDQPRLCRP